MQTNCLLGIRQLSLGYKLFYSAQSKTPTTTKSNLQLTPTRCVSRLTHARNVLQRETHAHIHHHTLAMQAVSFWVNAMPSIRSSFREVVTDKQLLTALHWRQQQNKQQQQHTCHRSHTTNRMRRFTKDYSLCKLVNDILLVDGSQV